MTHRARKLATSLMLATLLGVGLAGCGDEDEPSGAPAPESSSTTESPSESPSDPTTSEEPSTSPPTTAPPASTPTPEPTETTPTEPPASVPTNYREAAALIGSAGALVTTERFSTEGDAMYCVLQHEFIPVSCELLRGGARDAKYCGSAPTDRIGRIEMTGGNVMAVCNTDTIREPGAEQIAAGQAVASPTGTVRCLITGSALRPEAVCVNDSTRAGFRLTTTSYAILP